MHELPTVEGRALADLNAQLQAARAEAEALKAKQHAVYLVITEDAEGAGASLMQAAEWLRDRARRFEARATELSAEVEALTTKLRKADERNDAQVMQIEGQKADIIALRDARREAEARGQRERDDLRAALHDARRLWQRVIRLLPDHLRTRVHANLRPTSPPSGDA